VLPFGLNWLNQPNLAFLNVEETVHFGSLFGKIQPKSTLISLDWATLLLECLSQHPNSGILLMTNQLICGIQN